MTRYRPGDELKGNCTSQFSKPAANLSWTVNDVLVGIIRQSHSFLSSIAQLNAINISSAFQSLNNGWTEKNEKTRPENL